MFSVSSRLKKRLRPFWVSTCSTLKMSDAGAAIELDDDPEVQAEKLAALFLTALKQDEPDVAALEAYLKAMDDPFYHSIEGVPFLVSAVWEKKPTFVGSRCC